MPLPELLPALATALLVDVVNEAVSCFDYR